jgi:hypothetical protein
MYAFQSTAKSREDFLRSRLNVIRNVATGRVLGVSAYSMKEATVFARSSKDYTETQDSLVWIFGGGSFKTGIEIINKKSGLHFGKWFSSDRTYGQWKNESTVWRIVESETKPGCYRLVPTDVPPPTEEGGDPPASPPAITEKTKCLSQNGSDKLARVDSRVVQGSYEDYYLWSFDDPSSLETGFAPLNLEKGERSAAKARIVLEGLGHLGTTVGQIAGVAKAVPVAGVAYAIGGVFKIAASIAEMFAIEEEGEKDSIQVLYETLLPEMKKIVTGEFAIDNITDALGWAASGRISLNQVNTQLLLAAEDKGIDFSKGSTEMSAQDLKEKIGSDLVDLSLEKLNEADYRYKTCLGHLMVQKDRQLAFPAWMRIAAEHLSVYSWRMLLAPDRYYYPFRSIVKQYRDFVPTEFEIIKRTRLNQIKSVKSTDSHYGNKAANVYSLDRARYESHVTKVVTLAFGNPWTFVDTLDRMLVVLPTKAT